MNNMFLFDMLESVPEEYESELIVTGTPTGGHDFRHF